MTKVLIVDDEKGILSLISGGISSELGCDTISFLDPLEAIQYLTSHQDIDAIITDERMPHCTGLQLLNSAVAAGYKGHMIIFSGNADDSMCFDLLRVEMASGSTAMHFEVVGKPDLNKLLRVLKQAIDPDSNFG